MKISRIDIVGQNGNDGEHYEGVGAEWLAEFGLIAADGSPVDRSGQDSLLDPVEVPRTKGIGASDASAAIALDRACECAGCGCGSVESQGGQIEQKSEAV